MTRPRGQSLAVNLLLSLAVSAAFLGALEGGARLLEARRPPAVVADYIWDWEKAWDGDFYTIRSEGVGWPPWEEFNRDGLRDRTHAAEKPAGTRRLVFLGDSVTLGAGIEPHEAYPQVVQARLDREGRPLEVFNAALWGWSTRQERIAYERIVRKYSPDDVVLAVCLNDVPEVQNNLSRPPRLLSALHRRSALVRTVLDAPGREIQSVEQLFLEEQKDSRKVVQGFERFFAEVRALRAAVGSDGAGFSMIVFPFRFQVLAGAPPPAAQERIAAFCAAEGLRCLDLLPALGRAGEAAFVDYDHLSPAGAVLVADELVRQGVVPAVRSYGEVLAGAGARPEDLPRLLREGDDEVRAAAAWALREDEGALDALAAALAGDPSEPVRASAAASLGAIGPAARPAAAALFAALRDPRQAVRWRAAQGLAGLGLSAPRDVPALVAALPSSDSYVRGFAAWTLGSLGPAARDAVPALVDALALEDGYGRGGAAAALAKMGPAARQAVPALLEGLRGADGDRRWKAARTLGRIGPGAAEAVPALLAALDDPNEHVRSHAARAVGRIAPGDRRVVEALTRATGDREEAVRKEAVAALEAAAGK